jgi:HK97 family phage major capsid protein
MAAVTVSGNSTLTQDQVERLLIQPLVQRSTYLSLGFPTFTSNGEPIKVPSLASLGTPSFTSEGSAIAELSASTSEIELLPSSVYATKALLRISNEMIAQGVVNVQDQFSAKMVADTARIVDAALWNGGTADTGSPIGLANFTGYTNAGTVNAGSVTADMLFEMEALASLAFTDESALIWAMHPNVRTELRGISSTDGAILWAPSLQAGAPNVLLGKGVVVTSHLPEDGLWLIDRSQVAVGIDRSASVVLDGSRYLKYDETAVRVTFRADTKPMNPAAIIRKHLSS